MKHVQVIWKGPVLDATGYGLASREYVLALDRHGFDMKIEGYSWGFPSIDIHRRKKEKLQYLIQKPYAQHKQKILIYHTPAGNINIVDEIKRFDHCILNTVWETTKIPSYWLPIIEGFHAVTVPCIQNITAMLNSGVNGPLFLVPHGIDTMEFHPRNPKLEISGARGRFTFVSVFDFQHRKNPEALLKAYWEEFSAKDRVFMVIKTYGASRHAILNRIQAYKSRLGYGKDTAPLLVLTGVLNDRDLKGLYTLGNAFVLPTRGEGVGLPFMEALASGIPVIATGWGGHLDFLTERNSFLVKYNLSKPGLSMNSSDAISLVHPELFGEEGQLWAEVDVQDLRRKMRVAYENPGLCRTKGIQGRNDMLHYSWDKAGILFRKIIEKVIHT